MSRWLIILGAVAILALIAGYLVVGGGEAIFAQ